MSITTLEAAIARLEELKVGASPMPWCAEPEYRLPDSRMILTVHEYEAEQDRYLISEGSRVGDADLIVALSRTVDPILSVLRGEVQHVADTGERFDSNIVELAVAVLGEVEHE